MDVSIIIVNFNVKHFLQQCLESIRQSNTQGLHIETIVVDNDSVDGSQKMLLSSFPEVILIANESNLGFSKANNIGIAKAKGKYILILNPDTLLAEDTLSKCFEFMQANLEVVCLGVKMIDGGGKFLPESKRSIPGLWNSFCKLSGLSSVFPGNKLFDSYNLGWTSEDEIQEVEVLCGAFMFCRADKLREAGCFDEDYFMYGEDIDLSIQLAKLGQIIYFPDTRIIHYKGESSKLASFNYVKQFYRAMSIFVRKNYKGSLSSITLIFIYLAIFTTGLLSFLKKSSLTIFRVLLECTLLWFGFDILAKIWAKFYFEDINYYQKFNFAFNKAFYIFIWVSSAWFFGVYDEKVRSKHISTAVISGTALIILIYGLFPEDLRSSRSMIIISSLLAFTVFMFTSLIAKLLHKKMVGHYEKPKTIIVASESNAEKIQRSLLATNPEIQIVSIINTKKNNTSSFEYDLSDLNRVAHGLKANEIIFSSADMTIQEIMDHMTEPENKLVYRIASMDGEVIVGSQSAGTKGEIYSLYSNFRLSRSVYQRIKLLTDLVICFLLIVFFPFLVWYKSYRQRIINEVWNVCFRNKTWVSYRGKAKSFADLPQLKKGVFEASGTEDLSFLFGNEKVDPDHMVNYWYARWYSPLTDLSIIYDVLFIKKFDQL